MNLKTYNAKLNNKQGVPYLVKANVSAFSKLHAWYRVKTMLIVRGSTMLTRMWTMEAAIIEEVR